AGALDGQIDLRERLQAAPHRLPRHELRRSLRYAAVALRQLHAQLPVELRQHRIEARATALLPAPDDRRDDALVGGGGPDQVPAPRPSLRVSSSPPRSPDATPMLASDLPASADHHRGR